MSWVKLHRQLEKSQLWNDLDGYALKVAVHLLLHANGKREPVGGIDLNVSHIAKACGMTRPTARRCLDQLHGIEFLRRRDGVAIIVNFADFQLRKTGHPVTTGKRVTGNEVASEVVTPLPLAGNAVATPTSLLSKKGKNGRKKGAPNVLTAVDVQARTLSFVNDEAAGPIAELLSRLIDARVRKCISATVAIRVQMELESLWLKNPDATGHALAVVLGKDDFDFSRPADNTLGYIRAIVKGYKPTAVSQHRKASMSTADLMDQAIEEQQREEE